MTSIERKEGLGWWWRRPSKQLCYNGAFNCRPPWSKSSKIDRLLDQENTKTPAGFEREGSPEAIPDEPKPFEDRIMTDTPGSVRLFEDFKEEVS